MRGIVILIIALLGSCWQLNAGSRDAAQKRIDGDTLTIE